MIQNDDELAVVRRQLEIATDSLVALRRERRLMSQQQFELFAEPRAEMVRRLRSQIDAYLGIAAAAEAEEHLSKAV
jgi:hypothetical protein